MMLSVLLLVSTFGTLNPDVTQANIHQTICVKGWTASVRPSVQWSGRLKRRLLPAGHKLSEYQLDHAYPLELGGAPTDLKNLRLQPIALAHAKDLEENALNHQVCRGELSLAAAQAKIRADWAGK